MKKEESIKISISDQDSVNWALKKFKRLCESYGIIREYRKRRAYSKPSVAEKEKRKAAEKRKRKAMLKEKRSNKKI